MKKIISIVIIILLGIFGLYFFTSGICNLVKAIGYSKILIDNVYYSFIGYYMLSVVNGIIGLVLLGLMFVLIVLKKKKKI